MNLHVASALLSRLFAVLAVAMVLCLPWSIADGDWPPAQALGISAGLAFATAALLARLARGGDQTLRVRDALFIVSVGWFAAGALGALPYWFAGDRGIPAFHDAFFETISGLTTTGSTILTGDQITELPRSLHAWRMMTHWLGGIGIVVIFVALFPQLGVGAKHLFKSEVPGPITEGLQPKIKQTALTLFWIYVGLTTAETVLLSFTDMSVYEALLHSMSTMATGGFSTHADSITGYDSVAIETIIIVFMYLAGINFGLYYIALRGRGDIVFRDIEWRAYTLIVVGASVFIALLLLDRHGDFPTAMRKSAFQVLSVVTTTGFASDDFEVYPVLAQVLIVGLLFCGGMAGSTAGGMKVSRIVIMVKSALIELAGTVRPHAVRAVRLGRSAVGSDVLKQVFTFSLLFLLTAWFGAIWLAGLGVDLTTAITAGLTATANVGPGLGEVGPTDNFAFIPASGKYVLTVCMVLGRLEFFTVLALLLPSTWRR